MFNFINLKKHLTVKFIEYFEIVIVDFTLEQLLLIRLTYV